MEKLESRYRKFIANGENKYLKSLVADSRVPYNLNDVNSSNCPTTSADRKYLAYMIELWNNIKSSSDMNKKKEEFESKIKYFLLTEYFLSQNVLMRPIKLEEYFKLSKILINSGVIPQNKLTQNKKILIKV